MSLHVAWCRRAGRKQWSEHWKLRGVSDYWNELRSWVCTGWLSQLWALPPACSFFFFLDWLSWAGLLGSCHRGLSASSGLYDSGPEVYLLAFSSFCPSLKIKCLVTFFSSSMQPGLSGRNLTYILGSGSQWATLGKSCCHGFSTPGIHI